MFRDFTNMAHVAGTDADTTMAVNSLYVVDVSVTLTASRTYTLPGTFAVGDRIGILVSVGSTARRLAVTATAGDTCAGVAGGTTYMELCETGDLIIVRGTVANTTWVLESDRLGPVTTRIESTATQSITGGGVVQVTTALNNVISNPAVWWDTGTKRFTPKRPGKYFVNASTQTDATSTRHITTVSRSSGGSVGSSYGGVASTFETQPASGVFTLNGATEYLQLEVYYDANAGIGNTSNTYIQFTYLGP